PLDQLLLWANFYLLNLFIGINASVFHVWGIEIFTKSEVEAVNGTSVKLTCTFSSTQPVSLQTASVSWDFRSITANRHERILYYQEVPYPIKEGLFNGHVQWSGDIKRKDASITLNNVRPAFNGTYFCQVANPPDVHANIGETVLRVVDKGEATLCMRLHYSFLSVSQLFIDLCWSATVVTNSRPLMRVEEYRNKQSTMW
uniref:Ig-like domain-containing protein n=1 Tax=Poecilia latipinna TaxID=48699 RepID=A0A3B3VB75_9TELE